MRLRFVENAFASSSATRAGRAKDDEATAKMKTLRGNIFTSGPNAEHAITFAPGGDTILVADNIFCGPARGIPPATGCENVIIRGNVESTAKTHREK